MIHDTVFVLCTLQEVAREEERSAAAIASFQRRQKEMAILKEQIQNLQKRCATLEGELTVARQLASAETSRNQSAQHDDSDVNPSMPSSASAAEQEVLALSKRVTSLESQLAAATSNAGDLENKLEAANQSCSEMAAAQHESDALKKKLRKEVVDAQELVASLESNCMALQNQEAEAKAQLDESRKQIGHLTSTNASLSANIEAVRQEFDDARKLQSNEWEALLAEKDKQIQQLQQQNHDTMDTESSAKALLARREVEIEGLTDELREARERADDLASQVQTAVTSTSEREEEVCCFKFD